MHAAPRPTTLLMLDVMDFHTLAAHHPELAKAAEAEARRRDTERRPAFWPSVLLHTEIDT